MGAATNSVRTFAIAKPNKAAARTDNPIRTGFRPVRRMTNMLANAVSAAADAQILEGSVGNAK
jgi:hypothetical protein